MKDNFSTQADLYAQYRPTYPAAFYEYINGLVKNRTCAWDCGTGNGQVASVLADNFEQVLATDISAKQLANAEQKPNIQYSLQAAEQSDFPDDKFDLIVVAQAMHWFDFDKFYREANRTLKADGLFVVAGYGLMKVNAAIDVLINRFYYEIVGPYWDAERHYIDEGYKTIPFPFNEIPSPEFQISTNWTFGHLLGYLNTWSAVQHYIKDKKENPVDRIEGELRLAWGNAALLQVHFPVLLRVGQKADD